jgi:putative salt-induced outer membrane protein YdiY
MGAVVLGVIGLVVFDAAPVSAQVNTERLRVGEPEEGLSLEFDGAMTLKKGNIDFLAITTAARLEYNTGIHTPFIYGTFNLSERSGETFIQRSFAHARWTAMWWDRVGSEVFAQIESDKFRLLQQRTLGGAGGRFHIISGEDTALYFGTGYMMEYEQVQGEAAMLAPHPKEILAHRSTSYVSVKFRLAKNVFVNTTVFFQPRLDRPEDFRLLSESGFEVKLTEHVSLAISTMVRYDNDPPPTVKKTDLDMLNSIRLSF